MPIFYGKILAVNSTSYKFLIFPSFQTGEKWNFFTQSGYFSTLFPSIFLVFSFLADID